MIRRHKRPVQRRFPGLGGHSLPVRGETDSWITPPEVIGALGGSDAFDLDPCQCDPQPWPCAVSGYTERDDGLSHPWLGHVWLNPPYGPETGIWLARLADHGDGIALVFARTETDWFFESVWARADGLLFLRDLLYFHRPDGSRADGNSGAPSVLIAYGDWAVNRLLQADALTGAYVSNWSAVR